LGYTAASMVDVGGTPIDRYVVLEHLSEGGMGAIYVGKKLGAGGFEMEVVLKQLLPEFTKQEEFIDLFLREAKLSATLDHANIVHTIDLVTAGGEFFIVMEYLPGGDLRTLLKRAKRRGKRFSTAAAIYVCREVLSALAYAHVKRDFDGKPLKLIHRDVSPSNVLVSYSGEVKLTDFGIAKAATHNSLFYKVKGKIGYMSPEQAKSEPLDHRSDLYSLAVCMYEVLTGERLFVHAGLTTSADEIYSQPVPQLSRKVPGLPPELDAIMARALAISADTRYQTAGELNEALTRCAHRHGLLMAAPELAKELLEACGPIEQWRVEDEEDEDLGLAKRPGTEVYNVADDDDEDDEADIDREIAGGPLSIHSIAARANDARAAARPKTEVGKFQGVELTSLINLIDLEAGTAGSQPLVDLEPGGRGDSRSRRLDSDPVAPPPPPLPPPRTPPYDAPTRPSARLPPDGPPAARLPPPPPPALPPLPPLPTTYPQAPLPWTAAHRPDSVSRNARRSRSRIRPWMVIVAILVVAGVAAMIVALSGPEIAVQQGK